MVDDEQQRGKLVNDESCLEDLCQAAEENEYIEVDMATQNTNMKDGGY